MSDPGRPHRQQPTRLSHPWDSPGKNTGVGCHFPLQCVRVKNESEVAQLCPTLSDPMDRSLLGSSVHGIFPGKSTGVECHCLLRTNCLITRLLAFVCYCIHPFFLQQSNFHRMCLLHVQVLQNLTSNIKKFAV